MWYEWSSIDLPIGRFCRNYLRCSQLGAYWRYREQYIGLISSCETSIINIENHRLECILDTGSQVSIIPLWFFEKLYEVKLHTKPDWLFVKSASGDTMKYMIFYR